jgi:hypothetical protein
MSLYRRAFRHIDMSHVKEIHEEKIKKQKIAEIREQQDRILAELKTKQLKEDLKYCNWRREFEDSFITPAPVPEEHQENIIEKLKRLKITEGMTTSGMGAISLDGSPNDISDEVSSFDSSHSRSAVSSLVSGKLQMGVPQGETFVVTTAEEPNTQKREATFVFDATRMDTLVINVSGIGGASTWDNSNSEALPQNSTRNSKLFYQVRLGSNDEPSLMGFLDNGENTLSLPSFLRGSGLEIYLAQFAQNGSYGAYNTPVYINSVKTQRRTPFNVFVSLDDPEANAFIRDMSGYYGPNLTAEQKKRRLEQQLDASNQYILKMFGEGMPGSNTKIAEYEPQQSFVDNYHADKYGLPADYKDKLSKAQAYFQNNLNKVGYRTLGFTEPERMDALYDKAFKNQGFTDKQIDTIKKEKLLVTKYGESPSLKAEREKARAEREAEVAERLRKAMEDQISKNNAKIMSWKKSSGLVGKKSFSTNNPYMNISVGNLPSNTTNFGNDYGNIAQLSPRTEAEIDAMLLRGLERGDFGTGPDIQRQIDSLKNNLKNKTPGGIPKASYGTDFGQIAAHDKPFSKYPPAGGSDKWPGLPKDAIKNYLHPSKDPLLKIKYHPFGVPISSQKYKSMFAHYEPQGEVIKEKKTFKDLTKKIPGYYDGKPSPLGFPLEEPPKIVNGYHPDLVNGKKVSQRYNRLDPDSAKSMPPTGNPYIDKKVRAAAKKPK